MSDLHKEINLEDEICEHLAAHGWLYAAGDAANYDRARALFPADVIAWLQATQPKAWEALYKNHGRAGRRRGAGAAAGCRSISEARSMCCGTASSCSASAQPLALAQFKPALAMNPEILARYAANRLRVVRQVRYSAAQRELHRSGPVPQWPSGRHVRTEERLHAISR